ncbi:MAG TPA: hypothetical protein VEP90_24750 [Methylomirabilota bacterium]|nr:hypothetical protein [Methylomirabilota bacterium]
MSTIYYPPCSPEDGEGAECGYCSLLICCYKHWQEHVNKAHEGRTD